MHSIYGDELFQSEILHIRKVMLHFKNTKLGFKELCILMRKNGKKIRKLIIDAATRWNSSYLMTERFLEYEDEIDYYLKHI